MSPSRTLSLEEVLTAFKTGGFRNMLILKDTPTLPLLSLILYWKSHVRACQRRLLRDSDTLVQYLRGTRDRRGAKPPWLQPWQRLRPE